METFVPLQVLGRERGDLGTHVHRIGVVIEEGAVVEIDAVEGQHGHDVEIATGVRAAADARNDALFRQHLGRKIRLPQHRRVALEREEFLDEMRHRQHGRPHVEGKALFAPHVSAPADIGELFDDGRVEAQALQPNSTGDAPDAGADHDGDTSSHGRVVPGTAASRIIASNPRIQCQNMREQR